MSPETWSAIAAGVSAAIAVGAAVSATRSANRSAAAEERSAKAAEDVAAIESKRLTYELADRAESRAPSIDVGQQRGKMWTLAQQGTALVGFVDNHGPGGATIESVRLRGPDGMIDANRPTGARFLEVGESFQVQIPWPFGDSVNQGLSLAVVYADATGSGYRAEGQFTLGRKMSDPNGQPLWRSTQRIVRRL